MRGRTAIAWMAHRLRSTAVGWGLIAVLTCVALSACTSSGTGGLPTPSGSITRFPPSASGSESPSPTPSSTASSTTSPSGSPTPSPTDTTSPPPVPTPSYTSYPPAPVTGGGGTAGFQDVGLAVLGGVAIAAGVASIAYRRRMTRRS
jgi:hypothetical protein